MYFANYAMAISVHTAFFFVWDSVQKRLKTPQILIVTAIILVLIENLVNIWSLFWFDDHLMTCAVCVFLYVIRSALIQQ